MMKISPHDSWISEVQVAYTLRVQNFFKKPIFPVTGLRGARFKGHFNLLTEVTTWT